MRKGKAGSRQSATVGHNRRRMVVAIGLVLSVVTAGVIFGQRTGRFSQASRNKAGPAQETGITPASLDTPSKEYIYAGGRLLATEELPAAQAAFQGYHEGSGCNTISGWAWDSNNPNVAVSVDVFDGATPIPGLQGVPANMYREDLLNILASPNHGFSIPTPASLKNGASHSISVKFSGTSTILNNSPKPLQCNQTPALLGAHDGAGCNNISGWASDQNDPGNIVNVDIYNGATLIGTIAATQYRQDLLEFLGSPYHGFTFPTPASLRDGQPHTITVKFGGTSTPVTFNPTRTLNCGSSTPNLQGVHDLGDCDTITGYAWDTNDPGGTINVAIYCDDCPSPFLVTVPAQQTYPGVGNGFHGFKFAVPTGLRNNSPHTIRVKFSGIGTPNLQQTPRTIICPP